MLNLDNNAYKTQKEPLFLLILVKNYSNQFKSIPVIILMNWVIKYGLSWQLSLYQGLTPVTLNNYAFLECQFFENCAFVIERYRKRVYRHAEDDATW